MKHKDLLFCHSTQQQKAKTSLELLAYLYMMESVFKTTSASRGWHFYGKASWENPRKGERLCGEKEDDKVTLMHDPYAVAWKLKSPGKLIAETVGHVPNELSRAAWFFLE